MTAINATETAANGISHQLGWMNSTLSAATVPRSVTNVALMISLPMRVAFSPVSTSTAYTTASDVVDNAIPPICAAFGSQAKP